MNKAILIIDDDKDLRKSLKVGLEKENFAVVTAESAEAAREILNRLAVDGIVLDRMMGGRDGLSFLKELRDSGDDTPTVMLTGLSGHEHAIDGLSGGADDYLAKPFVLRELVLRLNNAIKKSAAGKEARKMPPGLAFADGEFFIGKKLLALSEQEKAALLEMASGGIAKMPPMTAKRLKAKMLANLKNCDIIAVRGKGYKLVRNSERAGA